ncbi:MAG: ROK family protein [Ignavibacteria bacterium]|nr:ROK family protein [Ignavibacteria bacterium]
MILIGVDLGGTNIKSVLLGDDGRVLQQASLPSHAEGGPRAVIEQVHRSIETLLADGGVDRARVEGIGVGVPGSIDFTRGLVLHPPNLPGWEEVPLESHLRARWGVAVAVDNDANCAALGEAHHGAGRGIAHFIGVTLGTGVGSGIILNGRIWHGQHGYGGELGHTSIDLNGPECGCGGSGCVEAYIGNRFMIARALPVIAHHPDSALYRQATRDPASLTPRDIAEAAAAGDALAHEILFDAGSMLGAAIASAANLLDITTFIIGGGVAAAGKPLFDGIISSANRRVLKVHRGTLSILPAALGNDAGMLGAASLLG